MGYGRLGLASSTELWVKRLRYAVGLRPKCALKRRAK
jgi:hypothetical protein